MTNTTYNRSEILKSAWTLVGTQSLSLSEAMKQAWHNAKLDIVVHTKKYWRVIVNGKEYSSVFVGDGNFGVYVWELIDDNGKKVGVYREDKKVVWYSENNDLENGNTTQPLISGVSDKKEYEVVFTIPGYYSFDEDGKLTFLCASSKDASIMKSDGIWNVYIGSNTGSIMF